MKQLFFFFATFAGVFTACNDNGSVKQTGTVAQTQPEKRTVVCYAGNSGKDSVSLTLHINGDTATGNLGYRFYEKDQSQGSLNGRMKGDTLIADYTFMSEGTQSVRQVIFLNKGNSLAEGYGDVEEKDGKMVFKNTGSIRFGEGFVLKRIECN